jgi:hypothetical protein
MALRQLLAFALKVIGDGVDRTVTVAVATAPISIVAPQQTGGIGEIPPGFLISAALPSAIVNLASSNGHVISYTLLAGVITFTYGAGDMPANNEIDVIYGEFTL